MINYEYMTAVAKNYDSIHSDAQHERMEYLNLLGASGWIFCGQQTEDWSESYETLTRRIDIFRRPID